MSHPRTVADKLQEISEQIIDGKLTLANMVMPGRALTTEEIGAYRLLNTYLTMLLDERKGLKDRDPTSTYESDSDD